MFQVDLGRVFEKHRSHRVDFSLAAEGSATGQHFVKDGADTENIAAVVHTLAPKLLGRHVGDCTDYRAASGYGRQFLDGAFGIFWRGLQLCHSEVENLHPAVGGDKQVFWLQVAMDNAAIVRRDKPLHNLERVIEGDADRQCSFR